MNNLNEVLENAYDIAFSKFDQQLVASLKTAEELLTEHKSSLSDEQLCKLYLTICTCKMKMDYPDDVMPMLLEAEKHAVAINNAQLLYRSLNVQANRLYRIGNFSDAVQKLLNLLAISPPLEQKISILSNLGIIYTFLGLFDKALECLFETLRLCEKTKNDNDYIRSCLNIGKCYFDMNSYEKSIEYFKVAQEMSISNPEDDCKMFLAVNMGLAYAHLSEFDKALELLNEAVVMEKNLEFVKKKGSLICDLGQVYERKGDYETALKLYSESLEAVRTTTNVILLVSVLNCKAGVLIKLSDHATAEELLLESFKITSETIMPTQREDCLRNLALLYQEMGMYQKALEYFTEFQNLNESVFSEKVKNSIIKYESDYLTEKLEHKAEIYRLHNVELVEKNAIISQNQKQLEQKQKQLETALAELSESNATKDKLFSIIAHDLRGPVSSLQTALQMILASDWSKDEQIEILSKLNEQTKYTFDLLENLLWWSQAQKEGFKLHCEVILLNPVMENIRAIYQSIAHSKQVDIDVKLEHNLFVYADKDALSLILRNLIGNAIKYSPFNSFVSISCAAKGEKVIIEVKDNGIGINPDIIQAIQNNIRIQSIPGTDSEKGIGLGLSLCYEFAHKMNGRIYLNDDCKEGTCFCVELPVK